MKKVEIIINVNERASVSVTVTYVCTTVSTDRRLSGPALRKGIMTCLREEHAARYHLLRYHTHAHAPLSEDQT